MYNNNVNGFTLIELLISISVITLLSSIAYPLIQISIRNGNRINSLATMKKIDTALNRFKTDVGGYPYADWKTTDPDTKPPQNKLAIHLALSRSAIIKSKPNYNELLKKDVDTAASIYEPGGSKYIPKTDFNQQKSNNWVDVSQDAMTFHLNICAAQWARINILCGNTLIKCPIKSVVGPWKPGGTSVLPVSESFGYGDDYLNEEIPESGIKGDSLIDRWGNEFIYMSPVTPGIEGYFPYGGSDVIDTAWFGFGISSLRTVADSLDHDIRVKTAPNYLFRPEIWSMGPDEATNAQRLHATTVDNIPAENYLRGLP